MYNIMILLHVYRVNILPCCFTLRNRNFQWFCLWYWGEKRFAWGLYWGLRCMVWQPVGIHATKYTFFYLWPMWIEHGLFFFYVCPGYVLVPCIVFVICKSPSFYILEGLGFPVQQPATHQNIPPRSLSILIIIRLINMKCQMCTFITTLSTTIIIVNYILGAYYY